VPTSELSFLVRVQQELDFISDKLSYEVTRSPVDLICEYLNYKQSNK
jgi:hypothetical protein